MDNKVNTTRLKIIQTALKMFLEKGYSKTSLRSICSELGIGLGHMSFYFPTKEHLLAVLIDMLCDFQWKLMCEEADDGKSMLLAICLELMSMASATEEDEIARDMFVSAYTGRLTLEIIRKNDAERSKTVYASYCNGWTDEDFTEAEALVSGIEYSTFMITETSAPLQRRITAALKTIMNIYEVPEELREIKINKVQQMEYRKFGRRIFKEFKKYVEEVTEQAFEERFK